MLLLKAGKGEDNSKEIEDLTLKFSTDVDVNSLLAQLCTYQVLVKDVELKCFQDILNVVIKLEMHEQQLIDEVITKCKLIHVKNYSRPLGIDSVDIVGKKQDEISLRVLSLKTPKYHQIIALEKDLKIVYSSQHTLINNPCNTGSK